VTEPSARPTDTAVTSAGEPQARLLIVEDDARLATLLAEYLSTHGFNVDVEHRGDRAVERIRASAPDLVVLDLMLPGLGGFDVCRLARERYAGGILMLTASKAEVDQAVGLELGADDYVVKPVEPRILLARIRSLLRRLRGAVVLPGSTAEQSVGPLTINRERREVSVSGHEVELTSIEFDVLWLLTRRAGEVVSREELYQQVRGIEYDGLDRGMDVHVSRIRHKLEAVGLDAASLKSVRGMGYLLVKR
jgi:two-component system, OmpR family, response regulator RstA